MKKIAFYASGGAGRVLSFFNQSFSQLYKAEFCFYDGKENQVLAELNHINEISMIYHFKPDLISHKSKEFSNLLSAELLECLMFHEIDFLFCFGDKFLKGDLILKYENRLINFHPSLLPFFPGLKALDQALNTEIKILGNTAHFIDRKIDNGPIILQSYFKRKNYSGYNDVLDQQICMLRYIWDALNKNALIIEKSKVYFSEEFKVDYSIENLLF